MNDHDIIDCDPGLVPETGLLLKKRVPVLSGHGPPTSVRWSQACPGVQLSSPSPLCNLLHHSVPAQTARAPLEPKKTSNKHKGGGQVGLCVKSMIFCCKAQSTTSVATACEVSLLFTSIKAWHGTNRIFRTGVVLTYLDGFGMFWISLVWNMPWQQLRLSMVSDFNDTVLGKPTWLSINFHRQNDLEPMDPLSPPWDLYRLFRTRKGALLVTFTLDPLG